VHVVVSGDEKDGSKKSGFFRLPAEDADRAKRIAFQASLDERRRVTFAEILIRGLDALERELATAAKGKPASRAKGKRTKA
jgi:hypothetical protein